MLLLGRGVRLQLRDGVAVVGEPDADRVVDADADAGGDAQGLVERRPAVADVPGEGFRVVDEVVERRPRRLAVDVLQVEHDVLPVLGRLPRRGQVVAVRAPVNVVDVAVGPDVVGDDADRPEVAPLGPLARVGRKEDRLPGSRPGGGPRRRRHDRPGRRRGGERCPKEREDGEHVALGMGHVSCDWAAARPPPAAGRSTRCCRRR